MLRLKIFCKGFDGGKCLWTNLRMFLPTRVKLNYITMPPLTLVVCDYIAYTSTSTGSCFDSVRFRLEHDIMCIKADISCPLSFMKYFFTMQTTDRSL